MADKDLNALFLDTLKDIYYAEKQIYKALPKMAKAANSDQLRAAFEKHHDETEGQIGRLEQIFELLGKAVGQILMAKATCQCAAGEIIVLLVDGEFGFAMPFVYGVFVLLSLLL